MPASSRAASGLAAAAPAGAAGAGRHARFTARTGSTSSSPASASPILAEGIFTFGDFRTRALRAGGSGCVSASARHAPPAAADASTAPERITRSPMPPRPRPGCRPARRSCSAISTWSAPASAAGSTTPVRASAARSSARPACTCGWPTRRRGAAQRRAVRLHHAVPGARLLRARCSRTWRPRSTSTGWSTGRAKCLQRLAGPARAASAAGRCRCAGRRRRGRAAILYHPYIYEAGERGPFIDAAARAQFIGLSTAHRLLRPRARGLRGPRLRRARLLRRHGPRPDEMRIAGGAARSPTLRKILGSVLGAPVRDQRARGGGCGRCRHDGRGRARPLSRHGRLLRRMGRPAAGRPRPARPGAGAASTTRCFPVYRSRIARCRPVWARPRAARREETAR